MIMKAVFSIMPALVYQDIKRYLPATNFCSRKCNFIIMYVLVSYYLFMAIIVLKTSHPAQSAVKDHQRDASHMLSKARLGKKAVKGSTVFK